MNKSVDYHDGAIRLIDQTAIPAEFKYVFLRDVQSTAEAIKNMLVRGAPAIGAAGALGMVLAARASTSETGEDFLKDLENAQHILNSTRPTAVNLSWGTNRMLRKAKMLVRERVGIADIIKRMESLGECMLDEDIETNRAIGRNGAELITDNSGVLTHCNAGSLATVGYGTALGVIRAAVESGKNIRVYADETRPRLQGMKLTCYELMQDKIDVTLIADNMAAVFMKSGAIQAVVVGADRIAANGDVANKIGTYSAAALAKYHNIPFYVAAPTSTIDTELENGEQIPIEERSHEEMTNIDGIRIAPEGVKTVNPSFDVTPWNLVTAIITEKEISYPPYNWSIDT